MSEDVKAGTDPTKDEIIKLLAEAEVARRRAARYSLLLLLAPVLVGGALLFYTFNTVRRNLREAETLRAEVAELEVRKKELREENAALELRLAEIRAAAEEAAASGKGARELTQEILKIESGPVAPEDAPRVFIQITDESQRQSAADLGAALRNQGYVVPDIEKVARGPATAEVRFRPGDQGPADKVAQVLKRAGLTDVKVKPLGGAGAVPGRLEVWFPADAAAQPPRGNNVVAVLGNSFDSAEEARKYARKFERPDLPYPLHVYRHTDGRRFYVTLGGYASHEEAVKRVEFAKRRRLAPDPYASTHAVGDNLYR